MNTLLLKKAYELWGIHPKEDDQVIDTRIRMLVYESLERWDQYNQQIRRVMSCAQQEEVWEGKQILSKGSSVPNMKSVHSIASEDIA